MLTREDMRGRMLDRDCYRAEISKHESGPDDDRCFCYGLVDRMTEDYLPKCHVSTSRDYQSGRTTYLPTGEDITKLLAIEQAIQTWNRRAQ